MSACPDAHIYVNTWGWWHTCKHMEIWAHSASGCEYGDIYVNTLVFVVANILTCRDADIYTNTSRCWHISQNVEMMPHLLVLNKANLRDLIAMTGLVILLKLNSNRQFFSQCYLEIWSMTSKNNRATTSSFVYNFKSIVAVWKRSIRGKIGNFLSRNWKPLGHLFLTTLSSVNHVKAIGEFKLEWQSRNT